MMLVLIPYASSEGSGKTVRLHSLVRASVALIYKVQTEIKSPAKYIYNSYNTSLANRPSADHFCKQFGPRSGPTERRA